MKKVFSIISVITVYLFLAGCNNEKTADTASTNGTSNNNAAPAKTKTIIFFGNSLTAGYGLNPSEAFPALIQKKIDSLGLPYKVINAGVSGETSSAGNSRVEWILKQPVDIFILELGGNDGLRGLPISETRKSLQSIIDKVKAKYPDATVVLAGMQLPPSMGEKYTSDFRDIFPDLAAKNKIPLIPFILEGVGGERHLNLQDGIHPTAEGHRIIAENVWSEIKDLL